MMRVDVGPRLVRTVRRLGPEIRTKAEEALRLVSEHFGEPHRHSGLGLRKIGRRSYEARVWLEWRIVFIKESDRLTAYDLMDHDQVRLWLKGRKGD
jgi:mRNA-degrading endonuclease RelE of RelBE toxin-antitoxin system